MDTKDLKSFSVGSIRGLFIYLGEILIWPICRLVTWYDDVFKTTIADKYFDGNTELTNCDLGRITNLEEALFNTDVKRLDDLSKFTSCTTVYAMCNECDSLESMSCVFPDSVGNAGYMFTRANSSSPGTIDAKNCMYFRGMFSYSKIYTAPSIKFKHFDNPDGEHYISADQIFRRATNLMSVPEYDASGWKSTDGGYFGFASETYLYHNLVSMGGFKDLGLNFFSGDTLFLGLCPSLSNQSVQNIIDDLYDLTVESSICNVTFHKDVYDSITEDQFALAASKNWTILRHSND